jgi:cytidine deaminase
LSSKKKSGVPDRLQSLYEVAKRFREASYSPYSGHKVGAAIRTSTGEIFGGCNVENSSYGATVCAERVAIQKAVSEGHLEIREVFVVTDASPPWPPCGMCRQVIAEFGPKAQLYTANLGGEIERFSFQALFPRAFTPLHLSRKKAKRS